MIFKDESSEKEIQVISCQRASIEKMASTMQYQKNTERTTKKKQRYGMNEEELRCFALQCNDYVEKKEAEQEDIENNEYEV